MPACFYYLCPAIDHFKVEFIGIPEQCLFPQGFESSLLAVVILGTEQVVLFLFQKAEPFTTCQLATFSVIAPLYDVPKR